MGKTIEITDEMWDKLSALSLEMMEQDPLGTAMPHLFQIQDWKKVYDWNLNGDTQIWITEEGEEIEELQDLLDFLDGAGHFQDMSDYEEQSEISEITRRWEDGEISDWLSENWEGVSDCSYSLEPFYVNAFLTRKAAQDHLDQNYYHYHPKARVYLNHAWRNPEAELISDFLCQLTGNSPYK
jgi:hypothetical protein